MPKQKSSARPDTTLQASSNGLLISDGVVFDLKCTRCPRLARFLAEGREEYPDYYCAPVAPFGDPKARLVLVGLAPAVEQVLERWSLGRRALQRLFNEYVGVGPKWVINRYRLHEAIERLAQGGDVDWARLAQDLGYFDQAHFIHDFKALVGRTPGEYLRQPG